MSFQSTSQQLAGQGPLPFSPNTPDSPYLSLQTMWDRMVKGDCIVLNGHVEYINGMAREAGSRPCHNWIVTLTCGKYYWDSNRGYFSVRTATFLD